MKPCEVCDSDNFCLIQRRGRIAEAGAYGDVPIHACQRCGYKMQNPRYEDRFYQDYYHELYREVAFGEMTPNQADIDEQISRSLGVMTYINKFIEQPGRMLDHGCAAGGTMLPFRDAGWEVFGVDPHAPSVEMGRQKLDLDIRLGVGEDLPFEDASIDLIYSLGSTEHSYDFGIMMEEVRRVLVPNGWFLIRWRSDQLWGSPMEYYNHNHYRFFTSKTWELALRRYGFSVIDATNIEYEKKPGEVYIMARSNLEPSLSDVINAIDHGQGDDFVKVRDELAESRINFAKKCVDFLNYCNRVENNADEIVRAVKAQELDYRLLLMDKQKSVDRGILEATRYMAEYESGRVY